MSILDATEGPEFEGIFEPHATNRPVMSIPPRMLPTRKLIDQIRLACDLDDTTAERVAHWAADWGERFGASTARPVIDMDGGGPACSWCGQVWPLCGHHHQSEVGLGDDTKEQP